MNHVLRRATLTCGLLAAAFTPLIALRVSKAATVGDVFLFLADALLLAGLLAVGGVPRPQGLRLPLLAYYMIVCGALLGMLFAPGNLGDLARFVFAVGSVLWFGYLFRPAESELRWFVWAYCVGSAASVLAAFAFDLQVGGRLTGWSGHPNHLGLVSCIALLFAIGLSASARTKLQIWAGSALVVVLGVGVVGSGSRAAVVGVAAGAGLLVASTANRRLITAGLMGAGLFIALVAFGAITLSDSSSLSRLAAGSSGAQVSESNAGREQRLSETLDGISRHPITGDGFRDSQYGHSLPLSLWLSAGLLGVAAWLVLWRFALDKVWRNLPISSAALSCAIVAYLAASIFSVQMWDRYIWMAVVFAAWGKTPRLHHGGATSSARPRASSRAA